MRDGLRADQRGGWTRRQWQGALGALAAGACLPTRDLHAAPAEGWIDAHVHVWTPDVAAYPLDPRFTVADMQPPSFTPEELLSIARPVGVTRIVLIQMSFYGTDNRYMLDAIQQYPGVFSGVGIVDHHAPDVAGAMKKLKGAGVRGFRLHPAAGETAGWVDDAGMKKVWRTAQAENLAVCPLTNPQDIPAVDQMCAAFPETRVVVDHFARIGVSGMIEEDRLAQLCRLARFPNVHVKTSAFYALGKKKAPYDDLIPMIRRLVDVYSPSRLMWATDCPYQVQGAHTYADSLALIRDRVDFLTPAEKEEILRGTAQRVFFS